ncbi:serine beta-lactamase-like protein LACTB, mitochondrial [Mytilus galloprovincialis]|uniref:serine beta-lactamase-like protein LACTB, mitochondrial n=1 Tax=Mytilus galloprovincialis TaxID=29158 RepID=UPI003F7B6880
MSVRNMWHVRGACLMSTVSKPFIMKQISNLHVCTFNNSKKILQRRLIQRKNYQDYRHTERFSTYGQYLNKKESWSKVLKVITCISVSALALAKSKQIFSVGKCEETDKVKDEKSGDFNNSMAMFEAINKARDLIQRIKDETGSPGIVVGVSVNGKDVWKEGLGYSNVENRSPCTADTIFRIASISKSITMGMVAKLWENGALDLDKPVQHYLPQYPVKYFDGQKVDITTRQLVSHLGGIRHYEKDYINKNKINKDIENLEKSPHTKTKDVVDKAVKKDKNKTADKKEEEQSKDEKKNENEKKKSEFENKEYYIQKAYKSITESLTLFQDDPLVHKPGSKFLYTSHGWTLVSAVMEKAANKPFDSLMKEYFNSLGLQHTYLEENDPLIYNRGSHYVKNKNGRLVNAPYVNNSYKWAGGGFISDVTDLLKFGNIMLYSYQYDADISITGNTSKGDNQTKEDNSRSKNKLETVNSVVDKGNNSDRKLLPGYLKRKTMDMIFSPVDKTECSWDKDGFYGMGWAVVPEKYENGYCKQQRHYVSHTGGAIGASSVLLILPSQNYGKQEETSSEEKYGKQSDPPQGIVVTIITNMGSVGLNRVALEIAKSFESIESNI